MIRILLKSVISAAASGLISAHSLCIIICLGILEAAAATVNGRIIMLDAPSSHEDSLMRVMMMEEMTSSVQGHPW